MPIASVLFKDEAGNNVAAVEWDTDEWVAFCDADENCEWRVHGSSLDAVCAVTAGHLGGHAMAGVLV